MTSVTQYRDFYTARLIMTENRVIITANNQINQDIRVKGETMKADTAAWLCRKAKPKHGN